MKNIGIIFDCDGTLVNSEHAYFLSWQDALKIRNSSLSFEEYASFTGLSGHYIANKLHEKVNVDSPEAILNDTKKAFQDTHKDQITPIERTLSFVRQLAGLKPTFGFKMGVASAAGKTEILFNLERYNLVEFFDIIVSGRDDLECYSDPDGVNKPKPYIYLHTAKLLGLNPSHCIAFEDSEPGVQAASSAGLLTFAVPNTFTQAHDFSKAHYTIEPSMEIDLDIFFQTIKSHIV